MLITYFDYLTATYHILSMKNCYFYDSLYFLSLQVSSHKLLPITHFLMATSFENICLSTCIFCVICELFDFRIEPRTFFAVGI